MALLLTLALAASGQSEKPSFKASVSEREVASNSTFEINFTLNGAEGSQFVPPNFKDFIVVSGPNHSSSLQVFNGKMRQAMAIGYRLQPKLTGRFVIGSASIRVNGQRLTTEPITIQVVKGTVEKEQYFIRILPNKRQAYIGEQVLVDFKLYTQVGIEGFDIPQDPNYDGFYAMELRRFNSNTVQEEYKGKQYATKIFRRMALFPQQAGKLTIEPFTIQLAIVEEDGRPGFFFNRSIRPASYVTAPVEIEVLALPDTDVQGFCGAVGDFDIEMGIDRQRATTDEAVTLKLIIRGNGDMKRVQPPSLMLSDSFEVYPPKVVSDRSEEVSGEIVGEKTVEYLLLPRFVGEYSIQLALSFFNVKSRKYEVVRPSPFKLSIRAGSGKKTTTSGKPSGILTDILPNKKKLESAYASVNFAGSAVFYFLFAIPPLILLLLVLRKNQRESSMAAINPSKTAGQEAQKRLALAKEQMAAGNARGFYDEVSKAVTGYVCDKTGLPLSRLSKEAVGEQLASHGTSLADIENILHVLQTCEFALFAGMDNQHSMQSTYEKAAAAIMSLEDPSKQGGA